MRTVNDSSVLGVMRLFDSEEYYMKVTFALWALRAIVIKEIEYIDNTGCLNHNRNNPNYWIYSLTNELISLSWVSGYNFLLMGRTPNWSIFNHRTGNNGFYSYEEAKCIAQIFNDEKQVQGLFKLREMSAFASNNTTNPMYVIYELANGLLNAFGHSKLLSA